MMAHRAALVFVSSALNVQYTVRQKKRRIDETDEIAVIAENSTVSIAKSCNDQCFVRNDSRLGYAVDTADQTAEMSAGFTTVRPIRSIRSDDILTAVVAFTRRRRPATLTVWAQRQQQGGPEVRGLAGGLIQRR